MAPAARSAAVAKASSAASRGNRWDGPHGYRLL